MSKERITLEFLEDIPDMITDYLNTYKEVDKSYIDLQCAIYLELIEYLEGALPDDELSYWTMRVKYLTLQEILRKREEDEKNLFYSKFIEDWEEEEEEEG